MLYYIPRCEIMEYEISMELFDGVETPRASEDTFLTEKLTAFLRANGLQGRIVFEGKGPTVSVYTVAITTAREAKEVCELESDAMLCLGYRSVRFVADLPKKAVRMEIPNEERSIVWLTELWKDEAFLHAKENTLPIPCGKSATGESLFFDLQKAGNLFVGSSTGAGKSVFVEGLLASLLYKFSPAEVQLLLLDPKRVEFTSFVGLPHVIGGKTYCTMPECVSALGWALKEVERRYALFVEVSQGERFVFDVDGYNAQAGEEQKLSKIVVVIDEVTDLLLGDKRTIAYYLLAISQKARAAGIYLILTSQRVGTDEIPAAVDANFLTRIAFFTASLSDSLAVLHTSGAERLLGRGDGLFSFPWQSEPIRAQAPYLAREDLQKLLSYVKENYKGE